MKIPTMENNDQRDVFLSRVSKVPETMETPPNINAKKFTKESPAVSSKKRPRQLNAQVLDAETTDDEELPFQKSSCLWENIDCLPVFTMLPQKPHFAPLKDCNEDTREGTAIGHMWTFASLVAKVSRLQIEDPRSLFERHLEALDILEKVGFDVKAVVDRINELLAFKTKQEQVKSRLELYHSEIEERGAEREKLKDELNAINEKMKELKEQRATVVSQKAEEDARVVSLQCSASLAEDDLWCLKKKFNLKAEAPW